MPAANSPTAYGEVAKIFHWATALLILTLIPLGIIAEELPYDTGEALALKAQVFSVHKTLGVLVFFVALARILWALTQARPGLLHSDKKAEAFLATLVHWLLYLSIVLVPLSGWLHHAATDGFAPIWWPFGQSLPFVPKSETVSHLFGAWHWVLTKVLIGSLVLHILGAIKHHVIDKDGTLRRMWFGASDAAGTGHHPKSGAVAGVAVYAVALVVATVLGLSGDDTAAGGNTQLTAAPSPWTVQDGSIGIAVQQLNSEVSGQFGQWSAVIEFVETLVEGSHGRAEVSIAVDSLTLGSVTSQAIGPDFMQAEAHPVATFTADLVPAEAGAYLAVGELSLAGATVPVEMPFDLTIEGDTAHAVGQVALDRRDFNIGEKYPDEGTVGFGVTVTIDVTATRTPES